MAKKILFITHSASRTGAPILLLQLIKWLKASTDFSFSILVCEPGPLLPEFQALGETFVIQSHLSIASRILKKLFGPDKLEAWEDMRLAKWARRQKMDLVYVNTISPLRQIRALAREGYPVICHVHELDYIFQTLGYESVQQTMPAIKHYIAGSKSVQEYLTARWSISAADSTLIHEFTLPTTSKRIKSREAIRAELGVKSDEILAGSCGTLDWRKGADLFVQIARYVKTDPAGTKVRMLWVGAERSWPEYKRFTHDLKACGLNEMAISVEPCSNHLDYISAMDIFALTSREDPFPLVMLDAAAMGLPIVSFEGSGGGPEFIGTEAGTSVPYLDTASFAKKISWLAGDKAARQRIGALGQQKLEGNFTIDRQAPRILEVIKRFSAA